MQAEQAEGYLVFAFGFVFDSTDVTGLVDGVGMRSCAGGSSVGSGSFTSVLGR